MTILLHIQFLGRAAGPSQDRQPYYIVAKNIAKDGNSTSYQLISAMVRFSVTIGRLHPAPVPVRPAAMQCCPGQVNI